MKVEKFATRISCRVLTLQDHLQLDGLTFHDGPDAQALGGKRIARLDEVVSRFDPGALSRWFARNRMDLTAQTAANRLRPVASVPTRHHPDWLGDCWQVLERMCILGLADVGDPGDIPFVHLFAPLARAELQDLLTNLPQMAAILNLGAIQDLENQLCLELSNHFSKCLQHEFARYRQTVRATGGPSSVTGTTPGIYRTFLDALLAGEIFDFCIKYAAATRSAMQALEQWRRNMRVMLTRLGTDHAELCAFLGFPDASLPVHGISFGLSDLHNGGQSVARATFEGGHVLYYKPRDISMEAALHRNTGPLCTQMRQDGFLFPACVDRTGYGWVADVASGTSALPDYYYNAGFTLAVAWAFGGTDLHDENIVMAEAPVIVDGEMFASPIPNSLAGSFVYGRNMPELDTVLRSGLLPRWVSFDDRSHLLVNGLAGGMQQSSGLKHQRFAAMNTDEMELVVETFDVTAPHVPASTRHTPSTFVDHILSGFSDACATLKNMAEAWDLVSALSVCNVRFLVRDTNVYAILLQRLRLPQYALTVVDANIEVELLSSTFLADDSGAVAWPLCLHEKASLHRGDVPYFATGTTETGWCAGALSVPRLFGRSGTEVVRERLSALSGDQVLLQNGLIRASMAASRPPVPAETTLDAVATRIGDNLIALAVDGVPVDGVPVDQIPVDWAAPQPVSKGQSFRLEPLGSDLYGGRSGIALFLAALAATTGHRAAENLARRVFDQVASAPAAAAFERGGCVGPGSQIYALKVAGNLLRVPSYTDRALSWTAALSAEPIAAGQAVDWITGLAGEACALMTCAEALHQDYAKSVVLAIMRGLQDTNLSACCDAGHGLAGVIHALHRIGQVCPEATPMMQEASARLRDLWQPHAATLQSLSDEGDQVSGAVGWARGATGVIVMLADIEPQRFPVILSKMKMEYDTLAAGEAARVEMWLQLGEQDRALAAAQTIADRAGAHGAFRTPGNPLLWPGFFDGLAGIGYALLRAQYSDRLPSVLRLEALQ